MYICAMIYRIPINIFLLVIGSVLTGLGQAYAYNFHFKHINSQNGLPHQQVEALTQDSKGYIWIGTRNGLCRYDGYEMDCYYHEQDNPRSLVNSFVKHLFTDSHGRVWACTPEGLSRYMPDTDDFKTYASPRENLLSIVETSEGKIYCAGNGLFYYDESRDSLLQVTTPDVGYIVSLAVDQDDNLYFASNLAIHYFDKSMQQLTQLDPSFYEDFLTGADGVVPMMADTAGRLWVGRNGKGVSCMDVNSGPISILAPTELVRCISEDNDHNVWLGTERGIIIVRPDGATATIRHDLMHPTLLSDNAIYALLCDREGNLWAGSYFGGVDIMLTGTMNFDWLEPGQESHQMKGRILRSMVEVEPGILWIATEGDGLAIVNLNENKCETFGQIPQLGSNIHSLYYDRSNREMWIGTFRNGLFRYNLKDGTTRRYLRERGLDSDAIFYIARQRNGRIWIATTFGLRYYDDETDTFRSVGDAQLDVRFVYTLCIDRDDNIWAGMADIGLYRIDGRTGKIDHWEKGDRGLNDNYVTCLYQGSRGTLFIGTNVSGMQYMMQGDSLVRTFDKEWNLSNYTICSIIEDRSRQLWIATNQGLLRMDNTTDGITRYTTDTGLPINQFNFSSTLAGTDGKLYFGTLSGLLSFDPLQLQDLSKRHRVRLKQLIINGQKQTASTSESPITQDLDELGEIRLSYEQARQFSIGYGAVLPATAGIVRYQIRVDGIDREWRNVGTLHTFNGYRMSPGTYTLRIRANEAEADWSECPERNLKIVVEPPFWRSWLAYLLYSLLASAIFYFAWHYYRSRQLSKEAIRRAELENEKIRAIDQAKFEFFTSVSHELKTPLSLIKAPLLAMQRQEHLGADGERNLAIALKNTKKIEQLVDDLVTFNKVETDAFRLYVQQGNPMEFLCKTVTAFRKPAQEKNISLSIELEDNGEQVWFSPQYVEHIVGNLLSNALKFTNNGGSVKVKAAVISRETDLKDYLRIEVSDTGIGVVPEELENIFTRYYQTRRGYNKTSTGWGIGLSLVKRLAETHKGSVSVESKVGEGSTFGVLLCVSKNAFDEHNRIAGDKVLVPISEYKLQTELVDIETKNLSTMPEVEDEGRATILVVEDHAEMRDFLRAQLSINFRVLTSANGKEALVMSRKEMVHLVVSDVMMPEMDGFELCRILKGNMDTSHIPVILLTAKNESEDVATGYRAGADAYVSKPFDIGILEMQINNILKLVRSRQQEIVESATDDLSAASLSALDRDFVQRMKSLVEENLDNSDFSITHITTALGVSRSLLHVKMKNLMNMSMGDYIRHYRLERACQMLRDGNNVSETAYSTGFSDPNYFSKVFKKAFGENPTEYAIRYRQK